MLDGAMFLPEEVMIISFLRSTTRGSRRRRASPMSPVCTQPSASMQARVASSWW